MSPSSRSLRAGQLGRARQENRWLQLSVVCFVLAVVAAYPLFGSSSLVAAGFIGVALLGVVLRKPIVGLAIYCLVAPLGQLLGLWSYAGLNLQHFLGLLVPLGVLIREPNAFRRLPKIKYPVGLLAAAMLISFFISDFQGAPRIALWFALLSAGHLAMFFAALALSRTAVEQRFVLAAMLAGGAVSAVLNLFAYNDFLGVFSAIGIEVFDLRKGRFIGLTPNPNALSTAFVLVLPLTISIAASSRGLKRYLCTGISVTVGLVLLLAASRSAIIGCAVGLSILLAFSIRRNPKGTLGIIALLVAIVWATSSLMPLRGVSVVAAERLGESLTEEALGGRPEAVAATIRLVLENPFGVGYSVLSDQIHEYGYTQVSNPHNSILATAATVGWLGLFAILWMIAIQLVEGTRSSASKGSGSFLSVAFLSGIVAFWIHASFHSVLHFGYLWVYFALGARIWDSVQSPLAPQKSIVGSSVRMHESE